MTPRLLCKRWQLVGCEALQKRGWAYLSLRKGKGVALSLGIHCKSNKIQSSPERKREALKGIWKVNGEEMAKAPPMTCLFCRFAQRWLILRQVQILEFPAHPLSTALDLYFAAHS